MNLANFVLITCMLVVDLCHEAAICAAGWTLTGIKHFSIYHVNLLLVLRILYLCNGDYVFDSFVFTIS